MTEIRSPLVLAAAAALLAGCSIAPQSTEQMFPTRVAPETVTLSAHFTGTADPFSGETAARFDALVSGYLSRGHGPISISAANLPPRDYELVRAKLIVAGVPKGWIRFAPAAAGNAGDMTLSYQRYDVLPPDCPGWSVPMDFNPYNLADPGLGCASLHNAAVSAADPADLVAPQDQGPADPTSVARVGANYRQGSVPGTAQSTIENFRDQTAAGVTTSSQH
jgi:pilus assembly protein CpaD